MYLIEGLLVAVEDREKYGSLQKDSWEE